MVSIAMSTNPKETFLYVDNWNALGTLIQRTRFWSRWGSVIAFLIFIVGAFGAAWLEKSIAPYHYGSYFFVLCFVAILVYLARVSYAYFLLFNFKCPRCQNRWPGLISKAPLCKSCGLRIYEDS